MKKIYTLLLLVLSASAAFAQVAIPVTNAGSTGTTQYETAIVNSSNNAVLAGTSNTGVPVYIVVAGAGTTGQAQLATTGPAPCLMDSTISSAAGWYWVINSTTTGGECHAQSSAPAGGTWIIGYLESASTSTGVASMVDVASFVYGGTGGSMTWPSAPGIMVYAGSSAYGTSLTAPTGTIVGTSDTQTLTNKTLDGVSVTTMGFLDATSSIQTQLNAKAGTGANGSITSLTGLTTPLSAAQGGTGEATLTGFHYGNGTSADTAATTTQAFALLGAASAAQIENLFSGLTGCATTGFVFTPVAGDCVAQTGGSVSSGTAGHFTWYASSGTTVASNSNLDDGVTNANGLTYAGSAGAFAKSFNTTDTVDNSVFTFKTGSSGDSTCPSPLSGTSYLCHKSSLISASQNGGAYAPILTGGPTFPTNAQTATYQVLAADFLACKTIPVASGTFTITLVASTSQPTSGQCIDVINYGTGVVTIARSGQNLNGGTSSLTVTAGSATAPTGAHVVSDGTNYEAALWGGGSSGTITPANGGTGQNTSSSNGIPKVSSGTWSVIDFPERFYVPAANCVNAVPGSGWSLGSGGTVSCRLGTNNTGGFVAITDTSSTFAQFQVTIPEDWDTGTLPYIRFQLGYPGTDGASAHTIIPAIKVSCAKGDLSTSDDVSFNASHSSSTITLASATANLFSVASNIQLNSTDMTGCVAGSMMTIQVGRATDTATSAANFYGAAVTFPRLITVQAN